MNNFGKILLLILLNVLVSAGVTLAVLYYWENMRESESPYQLVTVQQEIPAGEDAEPTAEKELLPTATTALFLEPTTADTEEMPDAAEPTPVIRGAKVEISVIRSAGNLESETLRIVNACDEVVSLENWTLEDSNGNVLTFPNVQLLRRGIFIEVYTRNGHSTPYELYWNLDEAVWQSGETAVLKDVFGQIQATYRIP